MKTIHECRVELVSHTRCVREEVVRGECMSFVREPSSDFLPVSAARASFGKEDKTGENEEADRKLLKFLADNRHVTPFEYQHAVFYVECPLFVLAQIKTHRTLKGLDLATNVISRRYTSENIDFWIPDKWRKQSKSNKQASTSDEISLPKDECRQLWREACMASYSKYETMISSGLCREQARALLPEATLTSMYIGGTLRNWAGFFDLRISDNAQEETKIIASRIENKLTKLWPQSMAALFGETK